jgi:hypothetical protein
VVLEAGHCPHDEVPDQVNKALLDWLGSLQSSQTKPASAGSSHTRSADG